MAAPVTADCASETDSQSGSQDALPSSPTAHASPLERSPQLPRAVRGYTAAGIAEAEAAEELQSSEIDVKVADAPRRCSEVVGACTLVQVRTFDRPGLLVNCAPPSPAVPHLA